MRWFWLLCLTAAALSDIKERKVSWKLLLICGAAGQYCGWKTGWFGHVPGAVAGIGILVISKITEGGIGSGDGWFFLASAWYLTVEEIWLLLLGGLGISWIWSIGVVLKGVWGNQRSGKKTLPFLACIWPAGLWILVQ